MAKKTSYKCAWLRVDLCAPYKYDRLEWRREAEITLKQIKRHCDVESITIEADIDVVCSFCGDFWTEESGEYNGGCCDKDEQDFQQKLSHASTKEGE